MPRMQEFGQFHRPTYRRSNTRTLSIVKYMVYRISGLVKVAEFA
jgi:hypothetical protein